jgi:hypothetical protein
MAELTIAQLTELLAANVDNADLLPIWDDTASETKKITISNFRTAVGVSNWSESFSSTTQATSRWIPNNAATNVNAAIVPKGTGAIVAAIPDGTAVGGNSRGQYAVDLQMLRNNAAQVASGRGSVIGGGERNRLDASNLWFSELCVIAGGLNNYIAGNVTATISGGNTNYSSGNHNVISGGLNNTINTSNFGQCVISGGGSNTITKEYAVISGGISNSISGTGTYATIGGGQANTASATHTTVGGGNGNTASGTFSAIVGGSLNTAGVQKSFVGGGNNNQAYSFGVIGGGNTNTANSSTAGGTATVTLTAGNVTVPSGFISQTQSGIGMLVTGAGIPENTYIALTSPPNINLSNAPTISGSSTLSYFDPHAVVAGGRSNSATGRYATISGGQSNSSSAGWCFVGGGQGNTASGNAAIGYSVVVGGLSNGATGNYDAIVGGQGNSISGTNNGSHRFIGGGQSNTMGEQGLYSIIVGGETNSLFGRNNFIGGGATNVITSAVYSFIGGGSNHSMTGGNNRMTIGGGQSNTTSATHATVCGGQSNTASGSHSSVGGGQSNSASATHSKVGGGQSNTASGTWSFIGGGQSNTSAGYYNVIGGGFTNSGTANAAFTTQTVTTTNGTTAATLAAAVSNGTVRIGQLITGTGIGSDTYVAAISGTSLTLSKNATASGTNTLSFFIPHGVVVGGGNNQATGSYSFIGGGGDAGTLGSRNSIQGDWGFIGGGRSNQIRYNTTDFGVSRYDCILGGFNNIIESAAEFCTISGGANNRINNSSGSVIGGGASNNITFGTLYNVIAGGSNNSINGENQPNYRTISGGFNNSGGNAGFTISGGQNNATGSSQWSSIGGGANNTASGNYSRVGGGQTNTASAAHSFVGGGQTNTASGSHSMVIGGLSANSNLYGQSSHASGQFSAQGDAQAHELIWRRAITGTAQTELFLDGASVEAILPSTNSVWHGIIDISSICTAQGDGTTVTGDVAATSYKVTIKRIGTTTSLVGTVQEIGSLNADVSMAAVAFIITNNDTNESLQIAFTPPPTAGSTTTIRVMATFRGTQIKY